MDGTIRRVHLPRDWAQLMALATGTLRLSRRFHRPTGLDEQTRVILVVPAAWSADVLTLNGVSLDLSPAADSLLKLDITAPIRSAESHVLAIEIRPRPETPYLVILEIVDPA